MSSRGRPPKNGTPFDRLLKKQCQKGKNLTRLLLLVFLCQKSLVIIFSSIRFTSKSKQQKTRQNNCGQIFKLKLGILQEFQPQNLPELLGNGARPHLLPSAQPLFHLSKFRGRKSSSSQKTHRNPNTAIQ